MNENFLFLNLYIKSISLGIKAARVITSCSIRLFAKSPCVKGRANEWRVQGVMRAWMNIHNRRITQELPLIRRDWS